MDEEQYKTHLKFAGEKKPSMKRRKVDKDYTERCMYMITIVVEGRRPLLGTAIGKGNAMPGTTNYPRVKLTELGERIAQEWNLIPNYHPQIKPIALQVMPDHLHGILFVKEKMQQQLGMVIKGFKASCNKAYKRLLLNLAPNQKAWPQNTKPSTSRVEYAATSLQQTGPCAQPLQQTSQHKQDRTRGLLFEPGYNDRILYHKGQLQNWIDYLHDNPRRLIIKREHPNYFKVQQHLQYKDREYSAIGNKFLLKAPYKLQIQCSRHLTEADITNETAEILKACSHGAVLLSPCISNGEKKIMRAAFQHKYPLIVIKENGFVPLTKPCGKSFDACAAGQLLLIAPWQHHNERIKITRDKCLALNEIAQKICE